MTVPPTAQVALVERGVMDAPIANPDGGDQTEDDTQLHRPAAIRSNGAAPGSSHAAAVRIQQRQRVRMKQRSVSDITVRAVGAN